MRWPQIIMLAFMLYTFCAASWKLIRPKEEKHKYDHGDVVVSIFVLMLFYMTFAALLHAGGFW